MTDEAAQRQLDTRALELSNRAVTLVEQHMKECDRHRQLAADGQDKIERAIERLGDKVSAEVGEMHKKIEAAVVARDAAIADARDRIANSDTAGLRHWIFVQGGVIGVTIGLIAWLAMKIW